MYTWLLVLVNESLNWLRDSFFKSKITIPCAATTAVFCLLWNAINDPNGAINSFLILVIDLVASALPSTPPAYTIGAMLTAFSEVIPLGLTGTVYEIVQGVVGILAIYLAVKVFRFIPFFG